MNESKGRRDGRAELSSILMDHKWSNSYFTKSRIDRFKTKSQEQEKQLAVTASLAHVQGCPCSLTWKQRVPQVFA